MILTGLEIKKRIKLGEIAIDPFDEKQLGANSYDVRLHNKLLQYTPRVLDMKKENATREIIIPESGLLISPGELYLGRTEEFTSTTGSIVAMLEGRSSIGRLGIFIHITAGFGDSGIPGFTGYWTLEITPVIPVRIYPFVKIGQLYYHETVGEITSYSGKYQDNKNIQASMLYKDFENNI